MSVNFESFEERLAKVEELREITGIPPDSETYSTSPSGLLIRNVKLEGSRVGDNTRETGRGVRRQVVALVLLLWDDHRGPPRTTPRCF